MTVAELIERLQKLPQDAVVVKPYGNIHRDEYVETSEWLDVIDVVQSKGTLYANDYHWWDLKPHHENDRDKYTFRSAVVV